VTEKQRAKEETTGMTRIKSIFTSIFALLGFGLSAETPFSIDYDTAIHLDAEALAETGIQTAYEEILQELRKYIDHPSKVVEVIDQINSKYSIIANGRTYVIYDEQLDPKMNSWGNATFAFFDIINSQLVNSPVRFYALNGGNDLFGIFLPPQDAESSKKGIKRKSDWPYLPKNETQWFGMFH
jgi:hypothetical protein